MSKNIINFVRNANFLALPLCCGFMLAPLQGMAEDIDIFSGPLGLAGAPNVMILLDNSQTDDSLWASKFNAISIVLDNITAAAPMSVGLALWTPSSSSPKGAYIRFAPKDMSVAANKTALKTVLASVSAAKLSGKKDEPEGFYEIYKYYSGLAPYAGTAAKNPNADPTAFSGATYNMPTATACSRDYIVYIATNNTFDSSVNGSQSYEGLSAGPALPGNTAYWGDEWTRYLYRHQNPQIVTYVLDGAPGGADATYSAILTAEAKQGGGTHQFVTTQAEIVTALTKVFDEIQSVNSAFASASLPINATNRTLSDNQVYIGMFRPDSLANPRWFGNLKKYQLINTAGNIEIGDSLGNPAVNPLTGFLGNCVLSYWTTDSSSYWSTATYAPSPAGACPPPNMNDKFSDAPDGPVVEKGAVAEIIRKGNTAAGSPPTWTTYRKLYTLSGTPAAPAAPIAALTSTNTGYSGAAGTFPTITATDTTMLDWVRGRDLDNEDNLTPAPASASQLTRFSVHGDIIHSRPYIVDQTNLSRGTTVYYGANDGALRAVDTSNGKERWAFYAPESFAKLNRLRNNTPPVTFANMPSLGTLAKDYFFDGPLSAYQSSDTVNPANNNSTVWIYGSQRRGGRMIYAFDVSTPDSPSYKWRAGCSNPALTDTASCTAGTASMGQTWSAPNVAFVQGFGDFTKPVVIVGGGYDTCEDANTSSPSCASPKGNVVYVLDGSNGSVLASFATTRSVVADVALVDVNNDGYVDYAYVADTGGNLYRIDFVSDPFTTASLAKTGWTMRKIASTSTGTGRKFLNSPAVLPSVAKAGNVAKVYIALGSGDREHPLVLQYPYTTPVTNRFYVYVDDLKVTSSSVPAPTVISLDTPSSTGMKDCTVETDCLPSTATSCVDAGVFPTSPNKGWFMDLRGGVTGAALPGEQTVSSAVIAGGMVTFSTNRAFPTPPNTCTANLGEARGYWLNLVNASGAISVTGTCGGARSETFVGGGLPPSPVLTSVTVNGKVVNVIIGAVDRGGAASAPIQAQKIVAPVSLARHPVYWNKGGDN